MSTLAADVDPVATAPRVGADLCAARERLGWSLEAVAAALRIRLPFLAALERGRIADLPGNAYAIGFLRTYASTLGLDPDELTRRFRIEAAEVNQLTRLSFPAPVPSRGVPAGAVVLLGVGLAIAAYVGWYRLSGNGELPPEVVPPVPARLAPLAERAVQPTTITQSSSAPLASNTTAANSSVPPASASVSPESPSPASSSAASVAPGTPSPGVAPTATELAAVAPTTAPPSGAALASAAGIASVASSNGTSPAGRTDIHAPVEPNVPPTQAAAATTMPMVAAIPMQPTAAQSRIVLSATADAWMEVRDKSGQVLLNRVLHPGEFWAVPPQPNLLLTLGNAGGTDILVDGVPVPPLGASGAVRHDIPLDPDLLKAGKVPSAALPMTTASSDQSGAPLMAPSAMPQGTTAAGSRYGRQ
jgi:cytoskeleton protein RodZ